MINMSYCRFENTYRALVEAFGEEEYDLSEREERYKERIIELCKEIAEEYSED